jgi:uncharacterized protein YbaP (TraB family)
MSRRPSSRLLAALGLALALGACRPATAPIGPPPPQVRAPSFAAAPLLWEVTSQRGNHAWIYGTLHTGGATFVPQAAWDALAHSTTFVMETDIDHIDQNDVIVRSMLPADQSLEQLMTPAGWQRLVAAFKGKMTEAQLRRFKPWFVSVVLAQSFLPGGEATDQALKARAAEQGATLAYLETWQEQLDALEAGTDVASLELMLADLDQARRELDALVEAYRAGDVQAIVRITTDPASGMSPAALDRLLYARNRAWVPRIEELVAGGGAFIAVGAGHIPGPGGLIELLAFRGYQVKRVPANP